MRNMFSTIKNENGRIATHTYTSSGRYTVYFIIRDDVDTDKDGMPDQYEINHGVANGTEENITMFDPANPEISDASSLEKLVLEFTLNIQNSYLSSTREFPSTQVKVSDVAQSLINLGYHLLSILSYQRTMLTYLVEAGGI